MKTDENKAFSFQDLALYIAPITGMGYGLAFLYKLGIFIYFGIPSQFIELNLNSLIQTIFLMSPLFLLYIVFFTIELNRAKNKKQNKVLTTETQQPQKKLKKWKIISLVCLLAIVILALIGFIILFFKYRASELGSDVGIIANILAVIGGVLLVIVLEFLKKKSFF
ncbi:hypothetical protein [Terribacillus saccharophilus]|uniref:hypothetical protein n=1 Tax=Terribacillus saccharophilus TaxID=361277 RepID=UPI003D2BF195